MKNLYVAILLILTIILTNTVTNKIRDQEQFMSKNQIDVQQGICTYKEFNGNTSAINLDNGEQNVSCLITEDQYNKAKLGTEYKYRMVVLDGVVDSIHLNEV